MPELEIYDADGRIAIFIQTDNGVAMSSVADRAGAWLNTWAGIADLVATTSRGLVWTTGMAENLDVIFARLLLVPGLSVRQGDQVLLKARTAPAWVVAADKRRLDFEQELMLIYRRALEKLEAGGIKDILAVCAWLQAEMVGALKAKLAYLRIEGPAADKALRDMEYYIRTSLIPALRARAQDAWTEAKQAQKAAMQPGQSAPVAFPAWLGGWGRRVQHATPAWLSGIEPVTTTTTPVEYAHITSTARVPVDLWDDFDATWTEELQGYAWRVAAYAGELWQAENRDFAAHVPADYYLRFSGPLDDDCCPTCAARWEHLYEPGDEPEIGDSECLSLCRHWYESVPASEVDPAVFAADYYPG